MTADFKPDLSSLSELERGIVEALEGTVLDLEGLLYGYLDNYTEDAVRRAIQRLRRRGVIVTSEGGRRGFYRLASDERQADEN